MVVSCTCLQCAGQVRIVHETTTFLLVTLPNIHRFFFTGKVNNKPFLNLVINNLTTPQICSYTTLQFFVNRLFSDVCVSQSSVATCAYVGFLINDLLQIYKGIFQWKKSGVQVSQNCLVHCFVLMSLWPHIFGPPCIYCRLVHTRFIWFLYVLSQSTLPGRDRQTGRRAVYNGAVDWESGIKTFGNCKWQSYVVSSAALVHC